MALRAGLGANRDQQRHSVQSTPRGLALWGVTCGHKPKYIATGKTEACQGTEYLVARLWGNVNSTPAKGTQALNGPQPTEDSA